MRGMFAANAAAFFVMTAVAAVSFAPTANAITYTTTPFSLNSLGSDFTIPGSQFDYLSGTGVPSTTIIDYSNPIVLDHLTFTAGVNATVPQFYPNMSFTETLTIGSGAPLQVNIPFTLDINYSDTLTVADGFTFSYDDGSSVWQFVVNGFTMGPNPGGPAYADLTARVSQAPLPAALPLFASGLGAMGLFGWWRKRKDKRKPAAIAAA
jgi:hypothetical protein